MTDQPQKPSDRVFRDLVSALDGQRVTEPDDRDARVDVRRTERKGVPEVIFAEGKSPEQVITIVREMLSQSGRAIVSRASETLIDRLRAEVPEAMVRHRAGTWTAVLHVPDATAPESGGRVAIFAAGTSDLCVAEEARILAEEMGCRVRLVVDVGVAGIHRLITPLRTVLDEGVDVIIVAAGMDGALASVVAGLVPVPVIGLPTSVGYGFGGDGQAALMTMLQSCAPGLTVVNIDNAVGAGVTAAMIANSVAAARAGVDMRLGQAEV